MKRTQCSACKAVHIKKTLAVSKVIKKATQQDRDWFFYKINRHPCKDFSHLKICYILKHSLQTKVNIKSKELSIIKKGGIKNIYSSIMVYRKICES